MPERADHHDLAIVGFGFAGLATLLELSTAQRAPRIAVIADDLSGHGLAYRTTDSAHLLNVVAAQMSASAEEREQFAGWLSSDEARRACEDLGVGVPGALEFAPRVLFARYLNALREQALAQLTDRGGHIEWISGRAVAVTRGDGGWQVRTATGDTVHADCCVLAVGNDPRHVFGDLRHPALHHGPWDLEPAHLTGRTGPLVLIGSGLTAVDALLSARHLGCSAPVLALSRGGRLPHTHDLALASTPSPQAELAGISRLDELIALARRTHAAGYDWRSMLDALRPFTVDIWQRLAPDDQRRAVSEWAGSWNIYRHRMAPRIGAQVTAELSSGKLQIIATEHITPTITDGQMEISYRAKGSGVTEHLHPVAVIDCTGPQLDPGQSEQPLLRRLIEDGTAERHPTGLGFAADEQQQIAERLFLLGSLLTGQRWETVAVPELRGQAARVAAAVLTELEQGHTRKTRR